jgi:PAT family beta-lactamase induction signal transducer AmpG
MKAKATSLRSGISLAENATLRYIIFIALYFSQGIPEGITLFVIPAWMAMNGKSAVEIASYSAIVLIPTSMKILLAPMIEKYTYLPMGRRRPWLLFGQFGILCSVVSLSFIHNPLNNISIITTVVLFVHIFVMFQDIATDSLAIDIVPLEQQGKTNSFMWGAKTVGTSASFFFGSWLTNNYGFSDAVLLMSIPVLLIIFIPLLTRERKGEKLHPWSKGETSAATALISVDSWGKLFKSFKQVVMLRNVLLLLTTGFLLMAAIHFMRTMLPIFTIQELSWTNVYYSKIYSTSNLLGGIVGMIVGAFVIQRFGVIRLMQGSLILIVILAITMTMIPTLWSDTTFVCTYIALLCTFFTLTNIGILALAMQLCWKRISALQFTLCMTIYNLGLAAGAAFLGTMRVHFSWQVLFAVFAMMMIFVMIILMQIKTKKHSERIDQLEQQYLAVVQKEASLLTQ